MDLDQVVFNKIDLGYEKPQKVKLLISQLEWSMSDFFIEDDLYFHKNPNIASNKIKAILEQAEKHEANIVLLPELSVPKECIKPIIEWSENSKNTRVVIAGSHYYKADGGYISRCPVIINGKEYGTEKHTPAPRDERSPIKVLEKGLIKGNEMNVFINSPVGNFGVLICSDFLNLDVSKPLFDNKIDFLFVPSFNIGYHKFHTMSSVMSNYAYDGVYIAYSNNICDKAGDGRSALFAITDSKQATKYLSAKMTDTYPTKSSKVCDLGYESGWVIFDLDLNNKRPPQATHGLATTNVDIIANKCTFSYDEKLISSNLILPEKYHKNDYYEGREDILLNLYNDLEPDHHGLKIRALSGIAACGKTQTAIKYAFQNKEYYSYIIWIDADNIISINESILTIANKLSLPYANEKNINKSTYEFIYFLKHNPNWLVILDNVDNISDEYNEKINNLFKNDFKGSILITTQLSSLDDLGSFIQHDNQIVIDHPLGFTPKDAMNFILKRTRRKQDELGEDEKFLKKLLRDLLFFL